MRLKFGDLLETNVQYSAADDMAHEVLVSHADYTPLQRHDHLSPQREYRSEHKGEDRVASARAKHVAIVGDLQAAGWKIHAAFDDPLYEPTSMSTTLNHDDSDRSVTVNVNHFDSGSIVGSYFRRRR